MQSGTENSRMSGSLSFAPGLSCAVGFLSSDDFCLYGSGIPGVMELESSSEITLSPILVNKVLWTAQPFVCTISSGYFHASSLELVVGTGM